MILLPRAGGTVNAPPLIRVPGGAVVSDCMWQMSQPTEWKSEAPTCASLVDANLASREGAFVALMNRAKASMSLSGSSPQTTLGLLLQRVVSGTSSHKVVTSLVLNLLVIPISFR